MIEKIIITILYIIVIGILVKATNIYFAILILLIQIKVDLLLKEDE